MHPYSQESLHSSQIPFALFKKYPISHNSTHYSPYLNNPYSQSTQSEKLGPIQFTQPKAHESQT